MRLIQFTPETIPADYPTGYKDVNFYPALLLYIGYYSGNLPVTDYSGPWPVEDKIVYSIDNPVITINSQPVSPFAGNYYANVGDTVQLTGSIYDGSQTVTTIDIPVTLKMPLVRHANGLPTTDEIYLNTTITNGVLTVSGDIPWSGDWKILIDRVNDALARIGASWKLSHEDITILA